MYHNTAGVIYEQSILNYMHFDRNHVELCTNTELHCSRLKIAEFLHNKNKHTKDLIITFI